MIPGPTEDYGQEAWLRYRPIGGRSGRHLSGWAGRLNLPEGFQSHPCANSALQEWEAARQILFAPGPDAQPVACRQDDSLPEEGYQLALTPSGWELHVSHPKGLLYGTFHLIRLVQSRIPSNPPVTIRETPSISLRMLNHWDNIYPREDIERGYGGRSIFHWDELPAVRQKYADYARLLASVGINAIILNNVNADEPKVGGWRLLEQEFLPKLEALARVFRAWGIRIGISVSFASPMLCGELQTDDPRDPLVVKWWAERTRRIYEAIPDFLGYLIKADSEGQPGPAKYGLTHAEGSTAIANALAHHGGRLFWRAFVYGMRDDLDLVAQPYAQFKPLDGAFPSNVAVQIKYGPRDFQPREPVHPLLGALESTATALELQITQEYLGHDTHAVFLPTLWEEILQSPVQRASTLANFLTESRDSAIAGVSNVSEAPDWCGHLFAQANLYGFGRMAWNPQIRASQIAHEWATLTFDHNAKAVAVVLSILLESHEVFVGYTAPFCLGQVHGNAATWDACHYDPAPAAKNGTHLFHADQWGIGFDRSPASGKGVLDQYCPLLRELYASPTTCPKELLLWFHRLPWDYVLADGRVLRDALIESYWQAAECTKSFISRWETLRGVLNGPRFERTLEKFVAQSAHACLWAEHMTSYLERFAFPRPTAPEKPLAAPTLVHSSSSR